MDPSAKAIQGQLARLRELAAIRHNAYRTVVEAAYAAHNAAGGQPAASGEPGAGKP